MNIHDLRLRNLRVRMCVDLLFYCGEEIKRGKIEYASTCTQACIQPNLRAMNGDLRLPYKYCTVLSFRGPCH